MTDLITMEQIAEQTGRRKCAVRQWRYRFDDFPKPCCPSRGGNGMYTYYNWADVRLWLIRRDWWDEVAEVPFAPAAGRGLSPGKRPFVLA